MDDPTTTWPAWKFGLKREDLYTTLNDRYNTISLPLQDPEAFHHDVYEISREAGSADEFHRLMGERQKQRVRELHESLDSVSFEITGNPMLVATEQWQHAIQLFRTQSFDSLVRFFASYLPDEYFERYSDCSTKSSSCSETDSVYTKSTVPSSVDDVPVYLGGDDDDALFVNPILSEEPCKLSTSVPSYHHGVEAPLSPPESDHVHDTDSVSSPTDVDSPGYTSTNPPSRSMSFSGSESAFDAGLIRRPYHEDVTSQSDDGYTAATSVSDGDCAEARSTLDALEDKEHLFYSVGDEEEEFPTAQFPEDDFDFLADELDTPKDTLDSDTPTPRQEYLSSNSYIDYKSVLSRLVPPARRRSPSPKPQTSMSSSMTSITSSNRCDVSKIRSIRRSPEEAHCKIQKPVEPIRKRPKGRI